MNQIEEKVFDAPAFHERSLHNIAEWTSVLLFPFSTILLLGYNFSFLRPRDYLFVIPLALVGYFISDIITGFVHFLADNYGSTTTPIIGPNFIEPFRLHHVEPQAMCKHNLAISIGNSCMLAIPVQCLLCMLMYYVPDNSWVLLGIFMSNVMIISTVFTNLFHKWAHANHEDRPKIILFLQKYKCILSSHHHEHHHRAPHESHYCVTNGWANALLDGIDFWKKMEWMLGIFGLNPDITTKQTTM